MLFVSSSTMIIYQYNENCHPPVQAPPELMAFERIFLKKGHSERLQLSTFNPIIIFFFDAG